MISGEFTSNEEHAIGISFREANQEIGNDLHNFSRSTKQPSDIPIPQLLHTLKFIIPLWIVIVRLSDSVLEQRQPTSSMLIIMEVSDQGKPDTTMIDFFQFDTPRSFQKDISSHSIFHKRIYANQPLLDHKMSKLQTQFTPIVGFMLWPDLI
jgi:hypothetical protein